MVTLSFSGRLLSKALRLKRYFLSRTVCFTNLKMSTNNNCDDDVLSPPNFVQGMKTLNRDAFTKEVEVPTLTVPALEMKNALKIVKPFLLKMSHLPPIRGEGDERNILLHPVLYKQKSSEIEESIKCLSCNLSKVKLKLTYENWTYDAILKTVLPPELGSSVSGFSVVGHIIHLNLKPHFLDFKHVIGQVLLDKFSNIKTVVNKTKIIEDKFRNFHMEVLAGEPDFSVIVKENGCRYAFDFSKVFWNPRLVEEHGEITKKLNPGDVVYDVFAGVGPFAIPAAKKKCQVYANDLNPDSFQWLKHNCKLNKVGAYIKNYNLDGHEFIKSVIKDNFSKLWNTSTSKVVHIIMNLPACALEFLSSFSGLFAGEKLRAVEMPIVYCYFFLKKEEDLQEILKKYFIGEVQKMDVTVVRNVAPNKTMMRLTFSLSEKILCNEKSDEPLPKKLKIG